MKVNAIKISNILGIENLEIIPGSITFVEGGNGAGKTSVLEAIKAIVQGGHDATLLRNGAQKGEIVLVLEDGVEIHKKVSWDKSDTTVIHPAHGKVSRPIGYIEKLMDALSVNPVAFLTCSARDRANYLLEAMPLEVNAEKLKSIVSDRATIPTGHAFHVLATLHNEIYSARRDTSRSAKEKRASIAQLGKSLPENSEGKDWQAEEKILSIKLDSLKEEERAKKNAINEQMSREVALFETGFKEQGRAIQTEYDKRLQALIVWKDQETHKINEAYKEKHTATKKQHTGGLEQLAVEFGASLQETTAALATARGKAEEFIRTRNTQEIIARYEREAGQLEARAEDLSVCLLALDRLKQEVMENLPIKGLEIRNGEIYRDGIPFDRLNSTQQIEIAVEVAKLRAKDLPLICVDGIESMDTNHIMEFEKMITKAGLQAIVARVADGPLRLTTSSFSGKETR